MKNIQARRLTNVPENGGKMSNSKVMNFHNQ